METGFRSGGPAPISLGSPGHFPFLRRPVFFLSLQIKTFIFPVSNVSCIATKVYFMSLRGISGIQMEFHQWCANERTRTGPIFSLGWMGLKPVTTNFCSNRTSVNSNNMLLCLTIYSASGDPKCIIKMT